MQPVTVDSLTLMVSPNRLASQATGTVASAPVAIDLAADVQPVDAGCNYLGSIRVTSSAAPLEKLLSGVADKLSSDLGISLPATMPSFTAPATAEAVFDCVRGVRMINVSLPFSSKVTISTIAQRVGFSWPSELPDDLFSVSNVAVMYVPKYVDAPSFRLGSTTYAAPTMTLAVVVDMPLFQMTGVTGAVTLSPAGTVIQVGGHASE